MPHELMFDKLFLSVGAMKAGTTWLCNTIRSHPEVQVSYEKEVHYFYASALRPNLLSDAARLRRAKRYLQFDTANSLASDVQRRVSWTANWLNGPVDDAWFRDLFPWRSPETWISDFSNLSSLIPTEAWRELHGRTGKLRVAYTLREPIDRLWSHVRFELKRHGRLARLDEWSVDQIFDHIQEGPYLMHSDYVAAITQMREGLPSECLHVDFYDRIATDPRGLIADIERFLEITPRPVPDDIISRVVNPSPPQLMPDGLAERLAPFVTRQLAGLRALGLSLPEAWG